MSYQRLQPAFTLIELLVVVAIIGILSAMIVTQLATARSSARNAQRKSDLTEISQAAEFYFDDTGTYQPPDTGWYSPTLHSYTGAGFFNYAGGSYSTNSIASPYVKAGFFPQAPHNPFHKDEAHLAVVTGSYTCAAEGQTTGIYYEYMYYPIGQSGYALFADLENPTSDDIQAFNNQYSNQTSITYCKIENGGIHGLYGMNYVVIRHQ